uniref:Glycoside hydrolase family 38 central domain-containing protein n=1 Tax=Panagrolaimus sp. ES5 TaxID=591445 RepID=A0AC34FAD9_9BILA
MSKFAIVIIANHEILYNPSSKFSEKQNYSNAHLPPPPSSQQQQQQQLKPLNVHVVMHSHVDPGWLQTFEDYYQQKVKYILDLAMKYLNENSEMRFIWSEMSFLERWWRDAKESQKIIAKKLIKEGRLELTGGSWVMTDEATPYFWASIDNMVEGHTFVRETFNVTPTTSWSVDPFGHGMMIPYLNAEAGINSMVIGRLNSHLKEDLRNKGLLMFNWAQIWDETGIKATPLVNALPKTYYTTSDSCGMDSNVCCQFDLGPSARSFCNKRANHITSVNVGLYAANLVSQYRTLEPFYKSNSILVAVGDDFFFSQDGDWSITQKNYKQLFDYINSNFNLMQIKVKFSTVHEFFEDVRSQNKDFPLFTGDFFPYTEGKTGGYPYWTGFYVHRPFFKRAERLTQSKLRSHDLLSVLAQYSETIKQVKPARRDLALCQHHDSITGTSKPHVMDDYMSRLEKAFDGINMAVGEIISKRIAPPVSSYTLLEYPHETKDGRSNQHEIMFSVSKQKHTVLIINQGTFVQKQKVTLRINDPRIEVSINGNPIPAQILPIPDLKKVSINGNPIPAQILPVPDLKNGLISNSSFEIVFFVDFQPLELQKVDLQFSKAQPHSTMLSVLYSNNTASGFGDRGGAYTYVSTGGMESINSSQIPVKPFSPMFSVGPLISKSYTCVTPALIQTTIIDNGNALTDLPIHIELFSNQGAMDATTMMNIQSEVDSNDVFYTDVNGINVIFEGNFYPVASGIFIEDENHRLTILTGQATGATLFNKSLDIMVDRRLSGDDGKGLGRGDASDSLPSTLRYDILLENKVSQDLQDFKNPIFFSGTAYYALQNLLYFPEMLALKNNTNSLNLWPTIKWPCNIELINIRYIDEKSGIILLRELPFDPSLPQLDCTKDNYRTLYDSLLIILRNANLIQTSLTGTMDTNRVNAENFEDLFSVPLKIVALKFYY